MKTKKPYKNLIGKKFGKLTVVELIKDEAKSRIPTRWMCKCDCGNFVIVQGGNLTAGNTQSCGCLQKEKAANGQKKHNFTHTRLYVCWQHMKQRCLNIHDNQFRNYGGRGIKVCEEWKNFEPFCEWALSHGYNDNLTLDRIDVNGNYEPSNCRWLTLAEQQMNKRNNTFITVGNEQKTTSQWARELGCRPSIVYKKILEMEGRISYGFEQ